jgi:hypothetical protein
MIGSPKALTNGVQNDKIHKGFTLLKHRLAELTFKRNWKFET